MNKNMKQLLSLLLSVSLVLGAVPGTVFAASADAEEPAADAAPAQVLPEAAEADGEAVTYAFNRAFTDAISFDLDLSRLSPAALMGAENVTVDESDPAVAAFAADLDAVQVANEEGEPVPMTEEQKQQILGMFQQYLDHWTANANYLGVQLPFFLNHNDNTDELGVLGQMVAMDPAHNLDDVRAGRMTFDDLSGMIMTFLYGDQMGIEFYGDAILAAKDEALAEVEKSGARTEAQKLLVLNEWLAHHTIFDMGYIMNLTAKEGEEPPMQAEEPVPHEHYEDVYNAAYETYEKQITDTFRAQISAGLDATLRQQFYEGAIRSIIFQQAIRGVAFEQAKARIQQENPELAAEEVENQANAQADKFMQDNAEAIQADANGFAVKTFGEDVAKQLNEQADGFMKEHEKAIKADPAAFVEQTFGPDAAAQLAQQADAFIADAHENGLAMDPEHPDQKVPYEAVVDQQMAEAKPEELGGMTPNEAIPVFADQAAKGIADGVINYWEGSHIGCLGNGRAVCLGYSKAYAYLIQWLHPELYGKQGAGSDLSKPENWKTAEELYYNEDGALDPDAPYMVDLVRITFNAEIVMYGKRQDDFNSSHFWNAVKLDGKWYYIDPCYNDTYTEVMGRNRAETNGSMTHMYFLFSHTSTEKMYNGYYDEIRTMYKDLAVHQDYEDTWFARASSNISYDGDYFYYSYDSTDLFDMLDKQGNGNDEKSSTKKLSDRDVKLVRHAVTNNDPADVADSDYEALIEFNYKPEGAEKSVARVLNPETGKMEENEAMTAAYAKHMAECAEYPLLCLTSSYYDGKVYFNLANCIYTYDLETGHIALVREYNVIHFLRDKTDPFGGMALYTTTADKADMTLYNHPIAGMTIREDGKLHVSIGTRLGFISGKDPHDFADKSSFGYEFEESNFNPKYNNYQRNPSEDQLHQMEMMGMARQYNDNDEFMWAANVEDVTDMAHFAGSEHTYETVSVEATCGRNAYTEERCSVCGAIREGSRVEEEGTARDHHYLHFNEVYYTRVDPADENSDWRTGDCYVCTDCGRAVINPEKPEKGMMQDEEDYQQALKAWQSEHDEYERAATIAGHTYVPADAEVSEDGKTVTFSKLVCSAHCAERKNMIDCLLEDATIELTLKEAVTAELKAEKSGTCDEGITTTYTAEGEAEGHAYTFTKSVTAEPKEHHFVDGVCTDCGAKDPSVEPTESEPTEPTESEPTEPEPTETEPTEPEPTETEPTEPEPTETEPTEPEPTETEPTEPEPTEPEKKECFYDDFDDCTAGWYHEAVDYMVSEGLMAGVGDRKFAPSTGMTRGMMVTVLYSGAGKPMVHSDSTFVDVPTNVWYSAPVAWAQETGIVAGVSADHFAPNANITREQIAAILWRSSGSPEAKADLSGFADNGSISSYAVPALKWAVEQGIMAGDNLGRLNPTKTATRAEVAVMMMRFLDGSYDCVNR